MYQILHGNHSHGERWSYFRTGISECGNFRWQELSQNPILVYDEKLQNVAEMDRYTIIMAFETAFSGPLGSGSGSIPLCVRYALLKRERHVAPYLNCQNHGSREQQHTHLYVQHRRRHHGQFGLSCVFPPLHPRQKCSKT